jgi:quinol monooxygenase YgiN
LRIEVASDQTGRRLALSDAVIQLLLRMTLAPGDDKDVVDALRSVMLPARLDRGCARAQILRDIDAPEVISYLEEWPRDQDIQERIRSGPFRHLLALMEAAPSAPSIEFRIVTEVHGLEYVAAVIEGTTATHPGR